MSPTTVAVTMGSPRFVSIRAGSFDVVQAWFPPHIHLAPHAHECALFAVMLDGSFQTDIASRRIDCVPGTLWTEPLAEPHANRAGRFGAHVLVIQTQPPRDAGVGLCATLFQGPHVSRHPRLVHDARRMAAEFHRQDDLTPLALESLALGMFVSAAEIQRRERSGRLRWLSRAIEYLHANVARSPSVVALAREIGIERTTLCHTFRRRMGMTIGEYVRMLRLENALRHLTHGDEPIADVAFRLGYSDQAHLTRACRAGTGMPPAAYRRKYGSSRQPAIRVP